MPARRRTSPSPATRRPKVAGTTPAARPETDGDGPTLTGIRAPRPAATGKPSHARTQSADADLAGPAVEAPAVEDAVLDEPALDEPALEDSAPGGPAGDGTDAATVATPRGRRRLRPEGSTGSTTGAGRFGSLVARLRTVPVLAAALVVLVALAAFFGIATASLRGTPAAANTALTDLATTSEVSSQLGDALEALYSYDFARLDENERAARGVITEGFTPQFERLFGQVRELAPQQQAVVSAVVSVSAVQSIEGDRAVLVAFMDQQATTAASAEQVAASGRLTVTGELVDGRWKIAAVESR
ncbi:hypothetical protein ACVGOW_30900 [Pseudonocardia saturnea]